MKTQAFSIRTFFFGLGLIGSGLGLMIFHKMSPRTYHLITICNKIIGYMYTASWFTSLAYIYMYHGKFQRGVFEKALVPLELFTRTIIICPMMSFYHNYQNPSVFCFFAEIRSIVLFKPQQD